MKGDDDNLKKVKKGADLEHRNEFDKELDSDAKTLEEPDPDAVYNELHRADTISEWPFFLTSSFKPQVSNFHRKSRNGTP